MFAKLIKRETHVRQNVRVRSEQGAAVSDVALNGVAETYEKHQLVFYTELIKPEIITVN